MTFSTVETEGELPLPREATIVIFEMARTPSWAEGDEALAMVHHPTPTLILGATPPPIRVARTLVEVAEGTIGASEGEDGEGFPTTGTPIAPEADPLRVVIGGRGIPCGTNADWMTSETTAENPKGRLTATNDHGTQIGSEETNVLRLRPDLLLAPQIA